MELLPVLPPILSHACLIFALCCAGRAPAPFMPYLQPGWNPGPMGRKCANYHLQWKNKSCKRLCGFCCMKGWCPAAPSLSDRCFLPLLGKPSVHIRLCPPAPLNNLNPDTPSLISLTLRVNKLLSLCTTEGFASSVIWRYNYIIRDCASIKWNVLFLTIYDNHFLQMTTMTTQPFFLMTCRLRKKQKCLK